MAFMKKQDLKEVLHLSLEATKEKPDTIIDKEIEKEKEKEKGREREKERSLGWGSSPPRFGPASDFLGSASDFLGSAPLMSFYITISDLLLPTARLASPRECVFAQRRSWPRFAGQYVVTKMC